MFGRKKRENDTDELDEQWALASEQEEIGVGMPQVNDTYFLTKDENVIQLLRTDPDLKDFAPLIISHLNRTTRLSREEAQLLELEIENIITMKETSINEDDYEIGKWAKFEALLFHVRLMLRDAVGGWRGRLVTERRRITRIERARAEEQRRRWL